MKQFCLICLIIFANNVNAQITLFGEQVPADAVTINWKIKKTIDDIIIAGLVPEKIIERSQILFPFFEKIMKLYNIPDDFKYLAVVESNLKLVQSGVGARGVWQIMPETARGMGMRVGGGIDERLSIEVSTHCAMRYLQNNQRIFNNWILTAASYNCGAGCILKNMRKQETKDFFSLKLNKETSDYIYRILAVKLLFEEYHKNKKILNVEIKKGEKIKDEIILMNQQTPQTQYNTIKYKEKQNESLTLRTNPIKNIIIKDSIENIILYSNNKPIEATIMTVGDRGHIVIEGIMISESRKNQIIRVVDYDGFEGINLSNFDNNLKEIPKNTKMTFKIYEI